MIDTTMIALDDLIEQEAGICLGKRNGYGEKATRKGACPFCGGDDRFAVFVNDMPMHFYCGIHGNGCNKRGDAIAFLREYYHIGFHEACQKLELDTGTKYKRKHTTVQPPYIPCDAWQAQATRFASECKDRLWSEEGKPVLAYLRNERKLSDETIQRAGLGYNPHIQSLTRDTGDLWGLPETYEKLFITRGITIPWQVDGKLLRVNIRRFKTDILREEQRTGKNAKKYIPITGGSTTSIYGFDYADYNKSLVLVEGEFDKMLLSQEVPSVNVIATGSTCNGRQWPLQLAHFPVVLVSFDVEENKAGESSTTFWLQNIPHAIAWYPLAHDITDMMIEKHDLNSWVQSGIHLATNDYVYKDTKPIQETPVKKQTPMELWVQDFLSYPGYSLRINEHDEIAIGLPETDHDFQAYARVVEENESEIRSILTAMWLTCSHCGHGVTAFHHEHICYHCWFHGLSDAPQRTTDIPVKPCRFCSTERKPVVQWIWSILDADWMCIKCLSPMNKPVVLY